MGMNVGSGNGSGDPEVVVDVNTTPLIDVMLVLLVMLIITIPVQTHAVKLDMPFGDPPPPLVEPPPPVKIGVDFDGTLYWNNEVVSRDEMEAKFAEEATKEPEPDFQIKPDKLAEYKDVAFVLASAQRHGLVKIGLTGNEIYAQ